MFGKKFLDAVKINPEVEAKRLEAGRAIGFRGVRDNLGVTTVVTQCAQHLADNGYSVCILDFDFQSPNQYLSNDSTSSIMKRWKNNKEPIFNILNKTEFHSNVMYIGANAVDSAVGFMPLTVDSDYIMHVDFLIKSLISDVQEKFDVVLVDIPADIRNPESFFSIRYCSEVITFTAYDIPCINKLKKDAIIVSQGIPAEKMLTIVQVDDRYEVTPDYSDIDDDIVHIATIGKSANIANSLLKGYIPELASAVKVRDYNEHIYYKGVLDIIKHMNGGADL